MAPKKSRGTAFVGSNPSKSQEDFSGNKVGTQQRKGTAFIGSVPSKAGEDAAGNTVGKVGMSEASDSEEAQPGGSANSKGFLSAKNEEDFDVVVEEPVRKPKNPDAKCVSFGDTELLEIQVEPPQEIMQCTNQPGLLSIADGCSIYTHKGTSHWPAAGFMLDPKIISGTYDCPACSVCTLWLQAVPALGLLIMCPRVSGVPVCCYPACFNFCGGLGAGGVPVDLCYLPTSSFLPDSCTQVATWFCVPCACCYDWHDDETLLSSCLCCCGQVHKKTDIYA